MAGSSVRFNRPGRTRLSRSPYQNRIICVACAAGRSVSDPPLTAKPDHVGSHRAFMAAIGCERTPVGERDGSPVDGSRGRGHSCNGDGHQVENASGDDARHTRRQSGAELRQATVTCCETIAGRRKRASPRRIHDVFSGVGRSGQQEFFSRSHITDAPRCYHCVSPLCISML
jgi:hypothetical protein